MGLKGIFLVPSVVCMNLLLFYSDYVVWLWKPTLHCYMVQFDLCFRSTRSTLESSMHKSADCETRTVERCLNHLIEIRLIAF